MDIERHLLVEITDALFLQPFRGEAAEEGGLRSSLRDGGRDLESEPEENAFRLSLFLFGQEPDEIRALPEAEEPAAVDGLAANRDILAVRAVGEDTVSVRGRGHVVNFGD